MKSNPSIRLSIIIVSFNTRKITMECLRSIYKHAPTFAFEVIVVDNASTDGSVEDMKAFAKKHKNFTILTSDKNLGFSKANNKGIARAKGSFVFLLNSDTKIVDSVLTDLVAYADKKPEAGIVAPQLLNTDGTVQASIFRLPSIARAISQYWFRRGPILEKYALSEETSVEAVVAAAFLITPQALRRVGRLNESYFMYFEDLDYCRAVRKNGFKIYYVPSSKVIHAHGASGGSGVNNLLIDSSKKYFGNMQYYIYTFVLWSGQKLQKIF